MLIHPLRLHVCLFVCLPEWSSDIADLAIQYKDRGVVGVDIAGDELAAMDQKHIDAFKVLHVHCVYS